jgi:4-hydroxythreonine-4-phosphate dehydrogenase
VDHGTAFDIAGKGVADESSMKAALRTAKELIGLSKSAARI